MKKLLGLMGLLCILSKGISQSFYKSTYMPGKIYLDGRLPNILLGNFIRYKGAVARLDDFRNKIIILDFWFTHCTDCIAQFAKEDSLQKEFGNDIQIIPVAYESKETINGFLGRWEDLHHTKLSLPFIVGDTLLNKCFANPYFPHYVWIAQDKRVIAMTSEYFITKENIQALLRQTFSIKTSIRADSTLINYGRMDEIELNNYYHIKSNAHE